jgi:hypothetical protein
MYLSPDVHAQIVRDRRQALLRDAANHRLAGRTLRCSAIAQIFRRAGVLLGAAAISPDGCGGRGKPGVAGSR